MRISGRDSCLPFEGSSVVSGRSWPHCPSPLEHRKASLIRQLAQAVAGQCLPDLTGAPEVAGQIQCIHRRPPTHETPMPVSGHNPAAIRNGRLIR